MAGTGRFYVPLIQPAIGGNDCTNSAADIFCFGNKYS